MLLYCVVSYCIALNSRTLSQLTIDLFIQNALRVVDMAMLTPCGRWSVEDVVCVCVWQSLDNRRKVVVMAVGTHWMIVPVPPRWPSAMASRGTANGNVPPAISTSKSDFLVNGKYRLVRKIGSGSFGEIYLGINVSSGEVQLHPKLTCMTHIKAVYFCRHFLASVFLEPLFIRSEL